MIHRALRLLRVYHNLKQKDLAVKLEISASHLSEIEKGTKGVSVEMLEKYSEVFRLPVSSIALFAEATTNPGQHAELGKFPDKALHLLEWLDTITEVEPDAEPHPIHS